jgi:lipopolysaccharide heptosyltransferase II
MTVKQRIKKLYLRSRRAALGAIPLRAGAGSIHDSLRESIRRILFIRLDRVGDVILSTPAIEALKRRFPHSEITVLLRPGPEALLAHNPHVDRCAVLDPGAGLPERYRLLQDLRRRRFDLAIDPCDDWKLESALLAWLSGARCRIGYPGEGKEAFFTILADYPAGSAHMTDVIMGTLKPLGIASSDPRPRLYLTGEERGKAAEWLAGKIGGGKPLIGIHPGAFYVTQRWLPEYFAALTDRLLQSCSVILFGGSADEELVERIQSLARRKALQVITADIRWFAALLSKCRLLVCNNSGPLHVASALEVPTVSFMGPTVKELWSPVGQGHKVLRADDLPCIGCNRGACPTGSLDCMRRITPQMAAEAVLETL